MPLSKERMRERKKLDRQNVKPMSNLNTEDVIPDVKPSVQPNVKPDFHCAQGLGKHCGYCKEALFCPLGGYQYWFKQTYGCYDDRNRERCPIPA